MLSEPSVVYDDVTKEAVDHRGEGLGVDEVYRGEDLVVTHVHLVADGTRHTGETDAKLVI